MQYTVEDVSPVKKKVLVSVPAEEADAALTSAVALYRGSVKFDGFRPGKAPAGMVEKRFQTEIYREATTDLVNVHINEIMGELKSSPVSRIDFDGGQLERGKAFEYSFSFEVMPEFDLPPYEGLAVDQEESGVAEAEVDQVLERLRNNLAETVPVDENREPVPGDIAVLDFAAFDEQGEPVPGVQAENFNLPIGENQALPDFERLLCTMRPGQEKEGPVSFPDDFFNPDFAGKTLNMKVHLYRLQRKKLPELDDEFARKAGGVDSLEKLRETIRASYAASREELHKANAQKVLLDQLLQQVEFPLPESMVETNLNAMFEDIRHKMERQGQGLAALGKSEEELRLELAPQAEEQVKAEIFLLTLARTLNLSVSEQELDVQLRRMAAQSRQDFNTLKDYYVRNNLLFALRDRILADKAMDAVYAQAEVRLIPPSAAGQDASLAEGGTGLEPESGTAQETAAPLTQAPAPEGD